MEQTSGMIQRYPPVVLAVMAGLATAAVLLGVFLLVGNSDHPWLGYGFAVVMGLAIGGLTYRRITYRLAGTAEPPRLIQSALGASLAAGVVFGLYGLVAGAVFVQEPGESFAAAGRFTIFVGLMAAASTYRRRRWPNSSQWYEAAVAAVVVVVSVAASVFMSRIAG